MYQLDLLPRHVDRPAPDAVFYPGWLTPDMQQALLSYLRIWCAGGFVAPTLPSGQQMNHPFCCLGWDWKPYEYREGDRPFPPFLVELARRAVTDTVPKLLPAFEPDTAIVNWFPPGTQLGMHQDKSEDPVLLAAGSPIVTASLGDSCIFRLGNNQHNGKPYTDIELRSGDLIVFGGHSRMAFHGVMRIIENTAPPVLDMKPGRISITIRQARQRGEHGQG